jgi:hypothetical protein
MHDLGQLAVSRSQQLLVDAKVGLQVEQGKVTGISH